MGIALSATPTSAIPYQLLSWKLCLLSWSHKAASGLARPGVCWSNHWQLGVPLSPPGRVSLWAGSSGPACPWAAGACLAPPPHRCPRKQCGLLSPPSAADAQSPEPSGPQPRSEPPGPDKPHGETLWMSIGRGLRTQKDFLAAGEAWKECVSSSMATHTALLVFFPWSTKTCLFEMFKTLRVCLKNAVYWKCLPLAYPNCTVPFTAWPEWNGNVD